MPLRNHGGIRIWPRAAALDLASKTLDNTSEPSPALLLPNLQPAPTTLPVPFFEQEETNWCWAACIQMVMHYFNQTSVDQCHVASLFFEDDSCSQPDSFNFGCDPEDVKRIFANPDLSVECTRRASTVQFGTIQKEINEGQRPIAVALLWFTPTKKERGGHIIIVKGWRMFDGKPFVKVNDPWYGRGDVSFARLKSYYGPDDDGLDGVWKHTWTSIRRK